MDHRNSQSGKNNSTVNKTTFTTRVRIRKEMGNGYSPELNLYYHLRTIQKHDVMSVTAETWTVQVFQRSKFNQYTMLQPVNSRWEL